MSTTYKTFYDRYKELQEKYKIKQVYGLLDAPDLSEYDIVIQRVGSGYAHTKYRVLKNKPILTTQDLAVICDKGNLCFGYRTEGSLICVHTD